MATLRTDLMQTHEHEMQKCSTLAESFGKLADLFGGMHKASGDAGPFDKIASECGGMSKCFSESADYHKRASEAAKAAVDELGKTRRPDGISSIPLSDAPDSAFGFRAVPRHGSPRTPEAENLAGVPEQFKHLLRISDA